MDEGKRVVAGEAILSGLATTDEKTERGHAGYAEAVEALVREHSQLVYRIAYAALRSHQDAEDATQETFLRVLRYSTKLAAVEDPKTWLARIAWRVAVDRGKQRRRTQEIPLEEPDKPQIEIASAESGADEILQGAQISAALEKLVTALPDKLREPLVLSTIEEMSPRDVALTLGMSEAAVRSRVFRGRQILKEKLAGQLGRK